MKLSTLIFVLIISIISFAGCSNDDEDNKEFDFCNRSRELKNEINQEAGELVYLEDKDKYAIRMYVSPSIDEVNYYVLCAKPPEIAVNDRVNFSGKVYSFNEDENFQASIGGTAFYFIEVENINSAPL